MKAYSARDLTRLGLLGSVALVLFVLESLAPRPLPWMKLGLGNIGVLLALLVYGFAAALCISLLKLVVGGLLSGGLGGPGSQYSRDRRSLARQRPPGDGLPDGPATP